MLARPNPTFLHPSYIIFCLFVVFIGNARHWRILFLTGWILFQKQCVHRHWLSGRLFIGHIYVVRARLSRKMPGADTFSTIIIFVLFHCVWWRTNNPQLKFVFLLKQKQQKMFELIFFLVMCLNDLRVIVPIVLNQ